mgnify:FL=1
MRGRAEVVRWTAGRVEGHADVVARLHHAPSCAPDHPDAQDPVAFLRDVRSAFGDRIRISVDPGS